MPREAILKAAVCHRFDAPLSIEDIRLDPPEAGEVRVSLEACGICHSDIHFIDGAWGGELPAVFGHEGAGVVDAVGSGVTGVAPGDRVVVGLIRACGTCFHCQRDETYLCGGSFPLDHEHRLHTGDGTALMQGLRTGAFAEQVVVEQSQAIPIPADVPADSASLLACGVLTGWGAVARTARVSAGASVGVIGVGGVGINSVQTAAIAGAAPVIAIDLSDNKLNQAEAFGATHAINPGRENAPSQARALTGGHGLDYVFVTVGNSRAVRQGLDLLRRGGTLVLVGMPASGDELALQPGDIAGDGQRILGSKMGCANVATDVPELVELYRAGRLKLDELVTARYPLDGINDAIAAVKGGEVLRNVVVF